MSDKIELMVQQVWALIIGSASLLVGVLRLIPGLHLKITIFDAAVHIVTGVIFIGGAWNYVYNTNLWMGLFYILFGSIHYSLPHLIVGVISLLVSLMLKPEKPAMTIPSKWNIFSFKNQ